MKRLEKAEEQRKAERQFELDRLEKLGSLGTEALIAASPAEQGRILADLKKNEIFKGMSEDQILALAAKDSPEVARALAEKFKALAEGKATEREREMYDKLLSEKDARERATIEAWDKSSARAKETTERALDRMAETAQAFAKGQGGTPVIITGPGGGQTFVAGGPASPAAKADTKNCPNCGRVVAAESRHCQHCGQKFEGMP
jgi:phage-related tail protein